MERLLCLFSLLFGVVSSFFFLFSWSRCTSQCLLFGVVNEVRRIHTGGSVLWCLFCFGGSLTSAVVNAVMLLPVASRFGSVMNNSRNVLLVKVSLMWTFLAAVITSLGFRQWCSSFQVNSCRYNKEQDWHAFTPRHSDCFGAFLWLAIQTGCLWLSFLCQVGFYYRCAIVSSRYSRLK
ncbi:uncharacterized protein LOC116301121 [Actinia tenebrosa]|uniref:Uncharacterized protein LOC116301121 n=1 Tax=Actinia tenebrosa TaxID=6105 RepID=A0A6P8IGX1_ACTTE|nr:uncharacterized protein LOC116301121 [Actinia tenebrosa]